MDRNESWWSTTDPGWPRWNCTVPWSTTIDLRAPWKGSAAFVDRPVVVLKVSQIGRNVTFILAIFSRFCLGYRDVTKPWCSIWGDHYGKLCSCDKPPAAAKCHEMRLRCRVPLFVPSVWLTATFHQHLFDIFSTSFWKDSSIFLKRCLKWHLSIFLQKQSRCSIFHLFFKFAMTMHSPTRMFRISTVN